MGSPSCKSPLESQAALLADLGLEQACSCLYLPQLKTVNEFGQQLVQVEAV